jgi:hypothetical protein
MSLVALNVERRTEGSSKEFYGTYVMQLWCQGSQTDSIRYIFGAHMNHQGVELTSSVAAVEGYCKTIETFCRLSSHVCIESNCSCSLDR